MLSRLFWTPLTRDTLLAMRDGDELDHLSEFFGVLGKDVSRHVAGLKDRLRDSEIGVVERDLNVDATYLFKIGFEDLPAPPYGSVWLEPEGLLMGKTTASVALAYKIQGVEVDTDTADTIPDHLSRELEFVAHMYRRYTEAVDAGDDEAVEAVEEATRGFLDTYCLPWWPSFATAAGEHARTDFFRTASDLLLELCDALTEDRGTA